MDYKSKKRRKYHKSYKVPYMSICKEQVQYLLQKKQRQLQKKKRIKQIEQQFERKRKMKIQHFQHKIQQSQKSKQHHIKQKLQKNKKKLQHVDKVNKKAHQDYRQIVQKGLERRKQFYVDDETGKNTKFNSKAQTQQNFKKRSIQKLSQSKLLHSETSKQMDTSKHKVQQQMKQIQQKLSKAKNNHLIYQKQMMNRLYQKDRHHSQIQQKIRSHSMIEQQKNFKQIYGKNQYILDAQERVKGLTQKHLNDRKKSFQQKIKKLHQNIKFIESQKMQKFVSLQNKLSKIYQTNPLNRMTANKSKSHRQKVILNHLKLQQEKKHKAQEILKKHSQITAKNKIYKEKKDQILQAIKKVNPQINQ